MSRHQMSGSIHIETGPLAEAIATETGEHLKPTFEALTETLTQMRNLLAAGAPQPFSQQEAAGLIGMTAPIVTNEGAAEIARQLYANGIRFTHHAPPTDSSRTEQKPAQRTSWFDRDGD